MHDDHTADAVCTHVQDVLHGTSVCWLDVACSTTLRALSLTASEGSLTSAGWIAVVVPVSSASVGTCSIPRVRAWSVQSKDTFTAIQVAIVDVSFSCRFWHSELNFLCERSPKLEKSMLAKTIPMCNR